MNVAALLEELRGHGIEFRVDGSQLVVTAPKGAVTSTIGTTIRDRKQEILDFLAGAGVTVPTSATASIERLADASRAPLSSGQTRLWYLDRLSASSSSYNMPLALDLVGELDFDALRRALETVFARHDALRTTIAVAEDGEPHLRVAPPSNVEVPFVDLTTHPAGEREARCRDLLDEWAKEPFDLARGPLARARVIRLRADAHVLFFMPHHVVYDGVSHDIFETELSEAYRAHVANEAPRLPELPIRYADYAAWERDRTTRGDFELALAFFRERLGSDLPSLALPTRAPRPSEVTHDGETVDFRIPTTIVDALVELGRRDGATGFMVLLAGFEALMSRFSGQSDLVVGTPVANRAHPDTVGVIGFFANTLALRFSLEGDPGFRDLVRRTRDVCRASYPFDDVPFDRVVAAVNPARDRSRTPVFQCMFALDELSTPRSSRPARGELAIAGHRPCGTGAARTDISLWLRRDPDGISGTFEFASALFDRSFVETLASAYVALFVAALGEPERPVSELPILDARAVDMLFSANPASTAFPIDRPLHRWFEARVAADPDRIVLRCGDRSLTARELDSAANRLAHRLGSLGVASESRVGLAMFPDLDQIVAVFAILKAGGAYVPLDPSYPRERLELMLRDSGASLLLVDSATASLLDTDACPVFVVDRERVEDEPTNAPDIEFAPEQLAYVIYTSGSTGTPKGVMVEHRQTSNLLAAFAGHFRASSIFLHDTTLSFDISVLEIFAALGHGCEVVVRRELPDESESVASLITRFGVTHYQCTPSQATMLVAERHSREALGRLSKLFVGGEPLPLDLAEKLIASVGGDVVNVYGPTETTVWSTAETLVSGDSSVSIGRPIANTRVYVLDEHRRPVPRGVVGEIYIGGAGVARGYHDRSTLTAERFVPDPFVSDGSRMYRTGDLGRFREDMRLEHHGRVDFQVKLRGHRIELGEIESAIRSVLGVIDAAVVLRDDVSVEPCLVGYVVADAGFDLDSVSRAIATRLPAIMVPTHLVALSSLPRTPNGKLDRRALPAIDASSRSSGSPHREPETPAERAIAEVFRVLLKVPRVGIDDDFFALGGHSLLVVRLVHKLRDEWGIELSFGAVFATPTVGSLARRVESDTKDAEAPKVDDSFTFELRRGGSNLPLFCICGVHLYQPLADALGEGQPVYGIFVPAEQALFDGHDDLSRSLRVQELAAEYVKAVRATQPRGPYCLAGISFGGVLAFEIAHQLSAVGEEVRVLALLDSLLPRGYRRGPYRYVADHLRLLVRDGPRGLAERLRRRIGTIRDKARGGEDASLASIERTRDQAYASAMLAYDRHAIPAPVDLLVFRAKDKSALVGYEVQSDCGWGTLAGKMISVHHIEGDHLGIIDQPYVGVLARRLRAYLDDASGVSRD